MTTLDVQKTDGACGAFVRGVELQAELPDDTIAAIRAEWLKHKVLVFPEQSLDDSALARFARQFGDYGHDPFFESIPGHDHVAEICRMADETTPIFAENWHSDWSFQASPPAMTCLYGITIPPHGGNTGFINQEKALAEMPDELRQKIEGKVGLHSARMPYAPDGAFGEADKAAGRSMKIISSEEAYDIYPHPLIRQHPETGAETLFSCLGYIIGIEGMDDAEALGLLKEIMDWQSREEFQYDHRWEEGMLVMWDNRCVLHKASGGYEGYDRVLHRVTIADRAAA